MASISVLRLILVLRIITLLTLAASVLIMGLNNVKDDEDGTKYKFTILIAYRYVIAAGAIGFVYTLIQIPFSIYNTVQQKRWIQNGFLQQFDFYGDKVMAFLLASGVGVGFGVTFELKRMFGDSFDNKTKKFMDLGNISSGLLLAGFVFMAVLSVISSIRFSSSAKQGLFK